MLVPAGSAVFLVFFVGIAALMLGMFVWWVICLIQALAYTDAEWVAAGQSKLLFVLLMIFVGIIGTIAYVVVARPALEVNRQVVA